MHQNKQILSSIISFQFLKHTEVGTGLLPDSTAQGVQPSAMLALSQRENKKNATLQVTHSAMLHLLCSY